MKIRLDIKIDENVVKKFRDKFVRMKGDLSKKIEELMIKSLKGGN